MEKKNMYNVKVGDIFCLDRPIGRNGHSIHFFQVVALIGITKIRIKEINSKTVSTNSADFNYEFLTPVKDVVIPCKDEFLDSCDYFKDNDNSIGAIKLVQYNEKEEDKNKKVYIDLCPESIYWGTAYIWDGEPKTHYIDYISD